MTTPSEAPGLPALSKPQFIALMAMLMAINAISIDIMLPGLQEIGASLGVADENTRQYVITAYLLGMGCAQLVFGPLSDRFGRKLPLLGGLGLYALCALAIVFIPSFTGLLALRFIQGIGPAATRVITISHRPRRLWRPDDGRSHVVGADGLHDRPGDRTPASAS